MRQFFQRHQILFVIVIPTLLLSGMVVSQAAYLVTAAAVGYFFYHKKHDSLILLFLFILIFADTRTPILQFIKLLRIEMAVLLTMITFFEIRNGVYQLSRYFLLFLPFVFVALLALIYNPLIGLAINKTISFTMLYFIGLHYVRHRFEEYGLRMMTDIMYLTHTLLIIGLVCLPIMPWLVSYGGARYNGLMGNPNGMGIFITLVTPITMYCFAEGRSISSRYKSLAWTVIVLSLLLCSSRNALFSFTIFMVLYGGLAGSSFRRMMFLFVLLPSLMIILYNLNYEQIVFDLGLEKYFRVKDFESGSGRIYAWQHAVEVFREHPLIGCGFACEEYAFLRRTTFRLWATGHQGGVHNSYLAYLINTGVIGLSLYLFFLGSLFARIRNFKFVVAYVGSLAFSAMFESWLFSSLSAFHITFLCFLVFLVVHTNMQSLIVADDAASLEKRLQPGGSP